MSVNAGVPCEYRFAGTKNQCGTAPDHPVHRKGKGRGGSAWPYQEEYHRYQAVHQHQWRCDCGAVSEASDE